MGIEVSIFPWYRLNTLRCGTGSALLVQCTGAEDIRNAAEKYPGLKIIGGGSNTVGSDRDNIPVLQLKSPENPIEQTGVDADGCALFNIHAAASFPETIMKLAKLGWGGMAPLSGIPGRIGGAAAMNAGANGAETADFITRMEGVSLQDGGDWLWNRENGGFGYRTSPRPEHVVLTAITIRLKPVAAADEVQAIMAERRRRSRVTPPGHSAGSVFRNPPDAPAAGMLLENAGCKGLTAGRLIVSPHHANWIVNPTGEAAAASDAAELVTVMQRKVAEKNGINLHCEWRFV